jgi:hypothetical protein
VIVAVHALTGAALARFCKTRPQALLAGALSHLVADMLPHRDLQIPEEALLLAGAFTTVAAARGPDSKEFVGALGAALPDLENLVGRILGLPDERLLLPTHNRYHGPEAPDFRGQLLLALGCLALLALPARAR